MNETLNELMRDATRLTRGGKLMEATALLQRALAGHSAAPAADPESPPVRGEVLDGCVFEVAGADAGMAPAAQAGQTQQGDTFLAGVHQHASLTRHYKLYVPPGAQAGQPLPLIVMLHGCTQDADDFARGTEMNSLARERGFFVLYPVQSQEANPSRCWNWFKHNHQQRGRGEPALIASLTQAVMQKHRIDPDRVYVAGLSAGGAMAAIMGAAYPDIYAAVGVHSGLAPGVAANVGEALSAMNGGSTSAMPLGRQPVPLGARKAAGPSIEIATIVFHGDQDRTVNPVNGAQVMAARLAAQVASEVAPHLEQQGTSAKGRRYTRTIYADAKGLPIGEQWLVHGAGHAWFGGSASGSYTDPLGPVASVEMLRFFLEHPKHARGSADKG